MPHCPCFSQSVFKDSSTRPQSIRILPNKFGHIREPSGLAQRMPDMTRGIPDSDLKLPDIVPYNQQTLGDQEA